MKAQKFIFIVIMAFIVIDFVCYLPITFEALKVGKSNALSLIFKMLKILSCFGIGFLFYRVLQQYIHNGFLLTTAIRYLRYIGFLGLAVAIWSSLENATEIISTFQFPDTLSLFVTFTRGFLARLLVREPLPILLGLLVLLLAHFAQKALYFKSENESFI
ncbi:MAG: hypothetical protein ACK4GN_17435 [Runella sp.]